ncbi:hypothetical protein [Candidatus Clostridium stratigraminis]|uniref:Uncharacterized protein n=1 Tax=Candidatus Clostridium stratigraminis TaxID=3381661 RepID=A0ABW8T395_9CLOT
MTNMPIENTSDNSLQEETESIPEEKDSAYGYNDNLTAKLGGNYSKVIEYYDTKL